MLGFLKYAKYAKWLPYVMYNGIENIMPTSMPYGSDLAQMRACHVACRVLAKKKACQNVCHVASLVSRDIDLGMPDLHITLSNLFKCFHEKTAII
jgi:hypothetical protein